MQPPHTAIAVEDAALVEEVRAGRTDAFGELVRKYQDRVFNTCLRLCGRREDARDLTQEAFLKAFEALPGFRYQSAFYTWLFRVAVNLTLSHRRSGKRRRTNSLGDAGDWGQAAALADRAGNENPTDDRPDVHRRVIAAMNELDDDQRAVLVLRDIEGLDYREVGEILDIPQGTVKSRLFRARAALRDALGPWVQGQEATDGNV